MSDSSSSGEISNDTLAKKLKLLRHQSGLTLKQLSERCGISVSTLSKIENSQLSPTYEKIAALARGLSVEVGELFCSQTHAAPLGRRSISLNGAGITHITRQYDYTLLHGELENKRVIPLVATLKAHERSEFPKLHRHDGEEFIYVLSGKVTLITELYAPQELNPGDSCYFDSTMGHACLSAGEEHAKVLWVSYLMPPPPPEV